MATEQIPTTLIADDAVTNAKIGADAVSTTEIANDASISTSGNIATTGSGTLTVAGASTFSGGIANSGTITAGTIGSGVTGFTGAKEVDFWKLNADNTDSSGVVLNSTLERVGSTYFEKIGTGMTKDGSGNFSFPSTGKYLVQTTASFISNSGGQQYGGLELNITTNNSSYSYITNGYQGVSSTNYYGNVTTFYCIDVTDISNVKVQFKKYVSHTNMKLRGGSGNFLQTGILFIRLGDT